MGRFGINVNVVAPSTVEGPLSTATMSNEKKKERIARIPLGRLATAEDVANAVLFFVSDESSYVTAHTLDLNGGRD